MSIQSQPVSGTGEHIEEAKRCFLATKLIHITMVAGIVVFGAVALAVAAREFTFTASINNPLIWLALIGCIFTITLSFIISTTYRRSSAAPGYSANVRARLQHYQAVCILRWTITGTGALFSGIVMLITKNILPACFLAISVYFIGCLYPSLKHFIAFAEGN